MTYVEWAQRIFVVYIIRRDRKLKNGYVMPRAMESRGLRFCIGTVLLLLGMDTEQNGIRTEENFALVRHVESKNQWTK